MDIKGALAHRDALTHKNHGSGLVVCSHETNYSHHLSESQRMLTAGGHAVCLDQYF